MLPSHPQGTIPFGSDFNHTVWNSFGNLAKIIIRAAYALSITFQLTL